MAYVVKSNEAKNLNLPGRISKELISNRGYSEYFIKKRLKEILHKF